MTIPALVAALRHHADRAAQEQNRALHFIIEQWRTIVPQLTQDEA